MLILLFPFLAQANWGTIRILLLSTWLLSEQQTRGHDCILPLGWCCIELLLLLIVPLLSPSIWDSLWPTPVLSLVVWWWINIILWVPIVHCCPTSSRISALSTLSIIMLSPDIGLSSIGATTWLLVLLPIASSIPPRGVGSSSFNCWARSSSICLAWNLIETAYGSWVHSGCTWGSCAILLLGLAILLDLVRHVSVWLMTISWRWSSASTRASLPMVSVHAHAAIL